MQNAPELSKAVYISHAFERQFKSNILKSIDKSVIALILDLHKIPAIPIDSGCCGFSQLSSQRQAIASEINKEHLLESLQKTANSVKKTRNLSIYKNAMELCCHLQELDKKISLYISEINNIPETDDKIKKLQDFREHYIPQLVEKIMLFCDAALQTYKNQQKSEYFLLMQENIELKQKNDRLEKENKALKQTVNNLEKIINTQKKEILLKTQKISHLKRNNTKNKNKKVLLEKTIKKLENEIYNLKNENKASLMLLNEFKTNLKLVKKKLNEKNQKSTQIKDNTLSPNLFMHDIKHKTKIHPKYRPNPAISFFSQTHKTALFNENSDLPQARKK
jgi:chromosome segregation ATPase